MTPTRPGGTVYRMQIHEIYYNSPGPDYGNSSLNHERVQLRNRSGSSINLATGRCATKPGLSLNSVRTR